jgi:hypothetical protein
LSLEDDIALLSSVPLFEDFSEDSCGCSPFGAERITLARRPRTLSRGPERRMRLRGRFRRDRPFPRRCGSDNPCKRVGFAERGTLLGELALITETVKADPAPLRPKTAR